MAIINRFSPREMEMYTRISNESYRELEKPIKKIFRFTKLPELFLTFAIDPSIPQQPFSWNSYEVETNGEKIEKVYVDSMILNMGVIWAYLALFNLDLLLSPQTFNQLLKEFIGTRIVYQLIEAHDIQYNYRGFKGKRADTDPEKLFSPIVIREQTGYYYSKLTSIYDAHFPDNIIGRSFCHLMLEFTDYLSRNKTARGVQNDPDIRRQINEIIKWVKENPSLVH